MAVRADGKIVIGGNFGGLYGQSRTNIGQFNADGTVDPNFNPGASGAVLSVIIQEDGKVIVGGEFTSLAGQPRSYLGRLNPNGSLNGSFTNARATGFIVWRHKRMEKSWLEVSSRI
jgi:hypothetical protein